MTPPKSLAGNLAKASLIVAGMLTAFGIARSESKKIVQQFEENNQVTFAHGKHNVVIRTGGIKDIIYTSKGNNILILVPETMDKDEALQQVEEIIIKIKQKDNVK
jgi:hypothetical protein